MWWQIGLVTNAVVAIAYLLITLAVLRPLIAAQQLRANPLGTATAAIFFTCALHHGGHVVHMLLPYGGVEKAQGTAMRNAYDWEMAFWDIVTAAVGVYYWTLRRTYSALMRGATLFEDLHQREAEALELNDTVLQGMVVARMALDLDQRETALNALDASIASASAMISARMVTTPKGDAHLLRSEPATFGQDP
jgi:hypothetical protein